MKTKKTKTEIELVEEFLIREGFTEITEEEKQSPEFKDSLKEFSCITKRNPKLTKVSV